MAEQYDDTAKEKNGKFQHLVEYCLDLYNESKKSAYRDAKIAEIKESRKAYEQVEEPVLDPWEGASNIVLPLTTISVDNLEPRLVAGLIGKRPFVNFEMENEQRQDDQTMLMQTWFDNELEDVVGLEKTTGSLTHELLLEGTVYPMAAYDLDEVTRRDFHFVDPENVQEGQMMLSAGFQPIGGVWMGPDGNPATTDGVDTIFEGGRVELVPFNDVFIADDVEEWEKSPVIRKVYPTYAELMRAPKEKRGYIAENIDENLLKDKTERKLTEDQQSASQELVDVRVTSKEVIECIECSVTYIYQDIDQEEEDVTDFTEERLIVQIALDKKCLIRIIPLREINFKNEHLIKRIRLFPEQRRSYGCSLYGKQRSIQKGASKTFNMAINIAEVTLVPWFLYTSNVGFRGDVVLKPGQGVPVDSTEGLYFPRFNINPTHMIEYVTLWSSFWERLISIGDLQVGRQAEKKDTTATEVLAVIQEGNVKHNYQTSTIKEEFLSVIRTIYDLYYQYMPLDKTFLYNGEQISISRQQMRRPYKFRLTGSTEMSNKVLQRKEKEDLFTLTTQDPAGVFNPIPVREDLLKAWGITDTDRYINPQLAQILQAIQEVPGAAELFQESLQQAQVLAEGIQGGGEQKAAEAVGG